MSETWIWNKYWHFDRIASCFDGAGARSYDDAIADDWRVFFNALPNGASVLDLCTGNGAVAIVAAEASRRGQKGFQIIAVDAADIDPRRHVTRYREELADIEFQPRTSVERLPFPDATFDALVSQYGIEYSDLGQSIPELIRVLARGGRVRLALHAAEGSVAETSKQILLEIDFLLHDIDLVGTAQRCFRAVTKVERSSNHSADDQRVARESLAAFESALLQTGQRMATAADTATLHNSGATLIDLQMRRGQFEVQELIEKSEEVRTQWIAHRGRLTELINAAVTRDERSNLAEQLRKGGAKEISDKDLLAAGALIGHAIEAQF